MLRETNLGTMVNLETDNENRFLYLFIAFDASIQGFNYCRPVVSIDATHLKGKYQGALFTNDASWVWFLRRLKENFGEIPDHVIVSDRHLSINRVVMKVFPNAFHGLCIHHLLNDLKSKFKSKTKELEEHYYQTAKVYSVEEFNVLFYSLCSAVPGAKNYLEDVGLDKWTRSHSPSRKYNVMTTNILESMNAVLVKVRELPITAFVNEIRLLCQNWFYERRKKEKDCTRKLSTDVEKKLEIRRDQAQVMAVSSYDLCSPYYSKDYWYELYKGVVHPLPHITQWSIPEHISAFKIMIPDVRTTIGRRKKRRILLVGL
ncbi:hypothetical protein UlMin_002028 [Ulmus minor]